MAVKLKPIKYRVTGAFGDSEIGEIRDAFILSKELSGSALIFHPKDREGCSSIEMAHQKNDECYESLQEDDNGFGWINLNKRNLKALIANLEEMLARWP